MIEFSCPHCGRSMRAPEKAAGRKGTCRGCGESVLVPEDESEDVEFDAPVPARAPTRTAPTLGDGAMSHSLGKAAMLLGTLAFLICWIPFLGMLGVPLSALGTLLGGAGVVLALVRRGSGIGFPIAGGAISALALIVAISITGAVADAISDTADAPSDSPGGSPSRVGANNGNVGAPPIDPWEAAGLQAQRGDLKVVVLGATIGKVPLTEDIGGDKTTSQDDLLMIRLSLSNIGDSKKFDYRGWSGAGGGFLHAGSLEDDLGNSYKRIGFGFATSVVGQSDGDSLFPGKSLEEVLVFEVPIQKATYLKLELPMDAVWEEGDDLLIKIPTGGIRR